MAYALTITRKGAALVTGGSGGGGEAAARALAEAGSDVAITYQTARAKAEKAAAEIAEQFGVRATAWQLDICDEDSVKRTVEAVAAEHDGLHTFVHLIGAIFTWDSLGKIPPREFRRSLEIETIGFYSAFYHTLPYLRDSKGAVIACTTWANRRRIAGDGLSASPKAAIDSAVLQIALEEASNLVRANIVGVGSTDMGMGSMTSERSMASSISPEDWEAMLQTIPLGNRLGKAEELASAIVYLASDQASYVTGQTIIVDGGLSL